MGEIHIYIPHYFTHSLPQLCTFFRLLIAQSCLSLQLFASNITVFSLQDTEYCMINLNAVLDVWFWRGYLIFPYLSFLLEHLMYFLRTEKLHHKSILYCYYCKGLFMARNKLFLRWRTLLSSLLNRLSFILKKPVLPWWQAFSSVLKSISSMRKSISSMMLSIFFYGNEHSAMLKIPLYTMLKSLYMLN